MANQPVNSQYNSPIVFSGLLTPGVTTAGGLLSLVNNTGVDLIITAWTVDVATVSTGAAGIDVGVTSTNGTTAATNLQSNVDVHSAIVIAAAAITAQQRWVAGKWLTASAHSSADTTGMVASYYCQCVPVPAGG